MATHKLLITMALCSLAAAGTAGAGGVYRWTDRAGVEHYGDIPVAGAEPVPLPESAKRQASRDPVPAETGAGTGGASDGDAPDAESPEFLAARCEQKKKQLASYQNSVSVVERDALGNEREYSAQERDQLIKITRSEIGRLCQAPAS